MEMGSDGHIMASDVSVGINGLEKRRELNLSSLTLAGKLPTLAMCGQLQSLWLSGNRLTGESNKLRRMC
jgi:hypothetical protein